MDLKRISGEFLANDYRGPEKKLYPAANLKLGLEGGCRAPRTIGENLGAWDRRGRITGK